MTTKYIVNNASAQTINDNLIVSVSGLSGNADKLIKVKSDELGFDFITNSEGYETITYADALALEQSQTGGTLSLGKWYRIEAVDRGCDETTDFNTYGDIFLKAISSSRFSPDGYLLAINADYQGVGDYSDTGGYLNNVGVAYEGIQIDITTDVIIFNNRHWYPTGFFGNPSTITSLNDITSFCVTFPKDYTTKNGYIIEPQKIVYDLVNNKIMRMENKGGNIVNSIINDNNVAIDNFRFGDDNVKHNYINTPSGCSILNYPILTFHSNNMLNGTIVNPPIGGGNSGLVPNGVSLSLSNNFINDNYFINDHTISMQIQNKIISDSKIIGGNNTITVSSSTIQLGNSWDYARLITQTGGTFNGIITAITLNNQVQNYNSTKHRFINQSTTNITFTNSSQLKTYSGLSFTLKPNDEIEFKFLATIAYQKDINIYL
jgi:hypothetical protein